MLELREICRAVEESVGITEGWASVLFYIADGGRKNCASCAICGLSCSHRGYKGDL